MDWIHCNTCFSVPSESRCQLHLTNCGHLFCDNCLKKCVDQKCKTCGQTYSSAIPLNNQVKPDVQTYFVDVKDLFKNGIKQLQQAQQVSEFQKGHTKRLATFRKHQLSKASEMMKQAQELERKYRQILKENEALKGFVNSLGYKPNEIIHQVMITCPKTPRTPSGNNQMKGLSNPSMSSHVASPKYSPMHCQMSPGAGKHPSPSRGQSPSASFLAQRSNSGMSPQNQHRDSYMITADRISIRTPPMNCKLGPVRISPKNPSPRSSQSQNSYGISQHIGSISKIAQNINASRNSVPCTPPRNSQLAMTNQEAKIPIQIFKNLYPRVGGNSLNG